MNLSIYDVQCNINIQSIYFITIKLVCHISLSLCSMYIIFFFFMLLHCYYYLSPAFHVPSLLKISWIKIKHPKTIIQRKQIQTSLKYTKRVHTKIKKNIISGQISYWDLLKSNIISHFNRYYSFDNVNKIYQSL